MVGLNAMLRFAFLSTLLVSLMFAACVLPSFANARIYVSGIDPSQAYPNGIVRVYGSGATPKVAVTALLSGPVNETLIVENSTIGSWIIVGPSNLTLGSTFAGESGNWELSFLTPNVFPGYYSVYVFDNETLASDVVSFQVLMNVTIVPLMPGLNVTYGPLNMTIWTSNMSGLPPGPLLFFVAGTVVPSSGSPGTFVSMLGHSASGGEIDVYFDDSLLATVVGQRGDWSASFQVPNVLVGNHTIRAIDVGGRWMSLATFYVASPAMSFFNFPLFLLGLFAVAAFSGVVSFLLFVVFRRKQDSVC
jgi:hypothetical protein